jgi:protein-tyrosine phosphatase
VIDLHCHILPGIDDGARDLSVSLAMGRMMVAQGVTVVACTPHILPGLYPNNGPAIRQAIQDLQLTLENEGIPLQLVTGADVHMTPDFVAGIRSGQLLSIADSRYILVEPPHHTAPPQLEDFFFNLVVAGYVPILTHPERLSWVPSKYEVIKRLVGAGVWIQITAGSFTGAFGRNALYWSERMLDEGCVHILASDAHDVERRPPNLAAGYETVAKRVGAEEAQNLVLTRPMGILKDEPPSSLRGSLGVIDAKSVSSPAMRDKPARGASSQSGRDPGDQRGISGRLRRFFK